MILSLENHDEITYHDSVYRQRRNDWPGFLVLFRCCGKSCHFVALKIPLVIYDMAYTGGLTKATEILRISSADGISVSHLGVFRLTDWEAGKEVCPLSSQGLAAAGYDLCLLGHLHPIRRRR